MATSSTRRVTLFINGKEVEASNPRILHNSKKSYLCPRKTVLPMPHTLPPDPCNLYPPAERHYNSDLSIWLSVDPMSDKYPSTSPYTYCANNPVRLVDPDGRDIYEFDRNGNLINRIENKDNDIIRVVTKRGCVLSESNPYNFGTVIEANSNICPAEKTTLLIKDDKSRIAIFEQLARNTRVEWGTIHAENGSDEKNYILTSGRDDWVEMRNEKRQLYDDKYTAKEISHSHPRRLGNNCPSGYGFLNDQIQDGDRGAFIVDRKYWPNVVVKVFDANNGHYYELGPTANDIIDIDRKGERKPYNPYN